MSAIQSTVQVKIYRIFSTKGDKNYVGSTINELKKRMKRHVDEFNGKKNYTSRILFEEYGIEFCHIELIEECSIDTRFERERFHIENIPNCVNKVMPIRTDDEIDEAIKKSKERQKAWALAKKEEDPEAFKKKACEAQKRYYENHKEKVKERQAEYQTQNAEYYKQKNKEYHEAFKQTDKYKAKNDRLKEKIPCEQCGQIMMRANLSRHTKKHHPVE